MGLLDSLAGPMLGSLTGVTDAGHETMVTEVGKLLEDVGGIDGLLQLMETKGLGNIAASWIGTGANLPISPAQLLSIFDAGRIEGIAQKLGLGTEETATHLANLLPQLVDRLTPEGTVPEWGDLGGVLGTLDS